MTSNHQFPYSCYAIGAGGVVASWPSAETFQEARRWVMDGVERGAWSFGVISRHWVDTDQVQAWLVPDPTQPAQPALRV